MRKGTPAAEILDDVLTGYVKEMADRNASLSIAIFEFFSNPDISKSDNSITKQYLNIKKMWTELIQYGMKRKEFRQADPEAVFDLIVFSYQGVRMYGAIMDIDSHIPKRIIQQIKFLLLPENKNGGFL